MLDDGLGRTSPLGDLRPVYAVRTGALTTRERLTRALGVRVVGVVVPSGLEGVARDDVATWSASDRGGSEAGGVGAVAVNGLPAGLDASQGVLVINGRCVLPPAGLRELAPGQALVDGSRGVLAAALVRAGEALRVARGDWTGLACVEATGAAWLDRPWHVRTHRDAALGLDLAMLSAEGATPPAPAGVFVLGTHPVVLDPTSQVGPGSVLDATAGPIVVAERAVVRPGSTIIGPAYVGPGVTVLDRAIIKGSTAIGPQCKVAGEVGGTIFQGQANKAHDGHLGDSWVGQWANLGAGTTNSNLLNTYGEVSCRAGAGLPLERTGQQFLGAMIGDHVKTAIGTRIMTGSIIGTGAMIAQTGAVTGTVGAFSWCTDEGTRVYRLDKFVEVARTVASRRSMTLTGAYVERLGVLHAAAAGSGSGSGSAGGRGA